MAVRSASAALAAVPSLACSYLSARIVLAANSMFPDNATGTYGTQEPDSVVRVPGVIDGLYDSLPGGLP